MKINNIKKRIKEIKSKMGCEEAAHSMEDDLYIEVLEAIANGADKPELLAKEALKTQKLDFSRYCA